MPQAASSPPSAASGARAANQQVPERLSVPTNHDFNLTIPRLRQAPTLEDFLSMKPMGGTAESMVQVTGFLQREPHDGEPATQPTEAYLGYDEKNLYVVFVCHDEPGKVRAHETRREGFDGDDDVEIMLDTFNDRRRAYVFQTNPKGVQWDAMWTEASYQETSGNFDTSFDTVWYSRGKVLEGGYVVSIAIPFRSLRFPSAKDQTWGIVLLREITRGNEKAFWPRVSINEEGRLRHAAKATGMSGISPGRNIQFIPYGLLNSFQTVDDRDTGVPFAHYDNRSLGGTFGADGKIILNDSLVLDLTANPDFSQVESDEPQVTVNQRYRVYFPEKRPFFIENADYFRTPIDLFFTRNIVQPDGGIRLTGKTGQYSLGILSSDDRSPGIVVSPNDPLAGTRSYFNIARVSRDIFNQSSVGAIFTDWEYPSDNSYNRVGGIDSRLKFSPNLIGTFQAVTSASEYFGTHYSGQAYKADLIYTSRHWYQDGTYNDIAPEFVTQPGFVNRVDIREFRDDTAYTFRPKKGPVVGWGPEIFGHWTWDHTGLRLDTDYNPAVNITLKRQTHIFIYPYEEFRERLRPQDFPGAVQQNQDYHEHLSGANISSSPYPQLTVGAQYYWGNAVNFVYGLDPQLPQYQTPYLARYDTAGAVMTIRPFTALKIDNTYLFSRLRTREDNASIFNNHILRTKWNWQFTRELSLRVIEEYDAILTRNDPADPAPTYPFTYQRTTKNLNTDILITYLLHPGTAVYVGYNTNQQNLNRALAMDPLFGAVKVGRPLINDGRLFFVKVSYLFRF
jgi:hypothetical protein